MCGIIGLIDYKDECSGSYVKKAANILEHRGPDNQGFYSKDNIHLAVRRLKVHDLSDAANQPFSIKNSNVKICFNGAISNYKRLGKVVNQATETGSDTEVLLRAYLKWGVDFLTYIEGMFAIAIYDPSLNKIFIARDHTGIKPLYYYADDKRFIFSSEIKPILSHPSFRKEVNEDVILEYFSKGCVSPPDTLFKGIRQLQPGHLAIVNTREFQTLRSNPFWSASDHIAPTKSSINLDELDQLLEQTVTDALVADVGVGVQLSGGVDSSLIACYAGMKENSTLKTYSVIFDDQTRVLWKPRSEEKYIDYLLNKFRFDGTKYLFEKKELKASFKESIYAHEQPLYGASTSLYYLLAKYASKESTVLLSGEGMDDLFLGYYEEADACVPKKDFGFEIPNYLIRQLSKKGQINTAYEKNHQYIEELEGMGVERLDICSLLDIKFRLHGLLARNERSMMAHSIESRPPFCNHKLIEMRLRTKNSDVLSNNTGKLCIKQIAKRYFSDDFVFRKKVGFSSPFGDFLYDNEIWGGFLSNLNYDLLDNYLDTTLIRNIAEQNDPKIRLTGNNLKILFYALNFQLWHEVFFE